MEMVLGKGLKPEKIEKALAKAGGLVPGEVAWYVCKCNNFKPMVDAVVVTNARVIGLSTIEGFKFKAPYSVVQAVEYDEKRGQVAVTTVDGQQVTFKSVAKEDMPVAQHYLEWARQNPAQEVLDAVAKLGITASSLLVAEDGAFVTQKDVKRAEKLDQKEQRREAREAAEAAALETYGAKVVTSAFGGKTITVYRNGYVKVAGLIISGGAEPERLISIEATSDVSKKSAAGRTAGAVFTMGLNLATSNKRGDIYLTIVTDRSTYVLHEDPPTAMSMKSSKRLEAAGQAVLRSPEAGPASDWQSAAPATGTSVEEPAPLGQPDAAPAEPASRLTVSERLRELTQMRDEGMVSDEEFSALRARLLESL